MKKPAVVMWNHLDYATQSKALILLEHLRVAQKDPLMKTALTAALIELELWSNAPVETTKPAAIFEDDDEDSETLTKRIIH